MSRGVLMIRKQFLAILSLIFVSGLAGSHPWSADKPKKNSKANAIALPLSAKPEALSDEFPLRVTVAPRYPAPIKEKYQGFASHINKLRIPTTTSRNNYFRTHSTASSLTIIGWYAELINVEETPEGMVAKLKVSAQRANVIDGLYYYEYYLVNDRGARFIQWEHEPVQPLDVIGL